MALRKGRAVAANERGLHDHLHGMMMRREIDGWTWPDKGKVVVFETAEDFERYHLETVRGGYLARQRGPEYVAAILARPCPAAEPMAVVAARYGIGKVTTAKRAGKAEIVAALRAVLEQYGDVLEGEPAYTEACRVLEAA